MQDYEVTYEFNPPKQGQKTLVFINSLGSRYEIWNQLKNELADQYGTLFYNKRGHGKSDSVVKPLRIEDHAEDLIALLEKLNLGKSVFCGLSIGGLINLGLYKKKPELFAGAIFCCTAHKIGTKENWLARIEAVNKGGIEVVADATMERWFTESFRQDHSATVALYRKMLTDTPKYGYLASCHAIAEADYSETAKTINVPTICIAGEGDGSTPPEVVSGLNALLPNSKGFHLFKDCAHIPCVQQPIKLAEVISNFVSNL